jgi:1-acyl-sn-glycerol-3-phosphate acyltransferase
MSLYKGLHFTLGAIIRCIFRVKVEGGENLPSEGSYIVACNHICDADPVILAASVKNRRQIRFMAKKELFKIPGLNLLIKTMGAFPIDRSGADVGAIRHMMRLLESGESTGMFPQGTRHPKEDPRETSVKSGVGMIATHTEATVVPVFLYQKNFKHRIFRKTIVSIGKPIPFEEFEYEKGALGEYVRISKMVFDRICEIGEEEGYLK